MTFIFFENFLQRRSMKTSSSVMSSALLGNSSRRATALSTDSPAVEQKSFGSAAAHNHRLYWRPCSKLGSPRNHSKTPQEGVTSQTILIVGPQGQCYSQIRMTKLRSFTWGVLETEWYSHFAPQGSVGSCGFNIL